MGFVKDLHTDEKMAPAVGVLFSAVSENVGPEIDRLRNQPGAS